MYYRRRGCEGVLIRCWSRVCDDECLLVTGYRHTVSRKSPAAVGETEKTALGEKSEVVGLRTEVLMFLRRGGVVVGWEGAEKEEGEHF